MKQKINIFTILSLLFVGSVTVATLPIGTAFAADACTPAGTQSSIGNASTGDCAKTTSFSFGTCGTANVGITCLVTTILNFLSVLVGIAVVAGITVGGITYSTAGGNPAKVKKGGTIIASALGGLVLFLLMYAIINFLLPKGTLN